MVLAVPAAPASLPICEPTPCRFILGVPVDAQPAEYRDHWGTWGEMGMTHRIPGTAKTRPEEKSLIPEFSPRTVTPPHVS